MGRSSDAGSSAGGRNRRRGRPVLHLRPPARRGSGCAAAGHDAAAGDPRSLADRWALAGPAGPDPHGRVGRMSTDSVSSGTARPSGADGRHTSVTDLELTERGADQAGRCAGTSIPGLRLDPVEPAPPGPADGRARRLHRGMSRSSMTIWSSGSTATTRAGPATRSTRPIPAGRSSPTRCRAARRTVRSTERLDRVIARVRESGVDRAICFGHGHALRALTVRWLGLDLMWGAHFPLDTEHHLDPGRGEGAVRHWNARRATQRAARRLLRRTPPRGSSLSARGRSGESSPGQTCSIAGAEQQDGGQPGGADDDRGHRHRRCRCRTRRPAGRPSRR